MNNATVRDAPLTPASKAVIEPLLGLICTGVS